MSESAQPSPGVPLEQQLSPLLSSGGLSLLRQDLDGYMTDLPQANEIIKLQLYDILNKYQLKTYSMLLFSSRVGVLSIWTVISLIGTGIGFILWFLRIPQHTLLSLLIPPAYAQDKLDPLKGDIILGIFIALLITYILSVWVLLFQRTPNETARQFADFMAKGLFGVFVGALGTYLGLTHT
jgi:hypothetical protein